MTRNNESFVLFINLESILYSTIFSNTLFYRTNFIYKYYLLLKPLLLMINPLHLTVTTCLIKRYNCTGKLLLFFRRKKNDERVSRFNQPGIIKPRPSKNERRELISGASLKKRVQRVFRYSDEATSAGEPKSWQTRREQRHAALSQSLSRARVCVPTYVRACISVEKLEMPGEIYRCLLCAQLSRGTGDGEVLVSTSNQRARRSFVRSFANDSPFVSKRECGSTFLVAARLIYDTCDLRTYVTDETFWWEMVVRLTR